ncbi:MAG: hypothetical protein KUL83_00575 [Lentimicrobium sp.]|jgi:hypothetical protein|nr:hypothetical protein [Lentimicrobium sp.]MDD2528155.1 hypothetical protein [Lentimicrobiaceae bacterium]MDD4598796.1 hypothetical protein [Lentimicrobiaceae bacterium]MDY0026334.1 hypothetical protein [Lentimicrobium sp.]HAH59283.1 hypothetical protein [Bacteroidales bacterium]
MKSIFKITAAFVIMLILNSCLTVEKKSYTFEFTGENSGTLTIHYLNIISVMDDGQDVSAKDFKEMLEQYMDGNQIAEDFPGATNIRKRLYEENGKLNAEVKLDFPSLSAARLYQYDKNSPLMMCISAAYDSETYIDSNGLYGNDFMPVVFWPAGTRKLTVITLVSEQDESGISLVEEYRKWKAAK